ncbi:MAG: ABC transporter ATP-binding protein [Candidatus Bathyarchaeota archaeon]
MPSEIAIDLKNVQKFYKGSGEVIKVFEDVTFSIKNGEFVAIIGPTGCGKTTLLNLIAGLDRPKAGEISVKNTDITKLHGDKLSNFRAKNIGLVFQINNLIPNLTLKENLEIPLVILGMKKDLRKARINDVLKTTGLAHAADRQPATLSAGEKQIAAIARAITSDPEIIVMDEPTEYLDPFTTETILTLIKSSNTLRGKTLLVATHSRKVAQAAERILHLKKRLP